MHILTYIQDVLLLAGDFILGLFFFSFVVARFMGSGKAAILGAIRGDVYLSCEHCL